MKKLISNLTALTLCGQLAVTASATTTTVNYDSTQNASAQQSVDVAVDCEIAEMYAVTLPKMIQLDGSLDIPEYNYQVKVTGDFSPSKCIRVIPLDGAVLSDGALNMPLTVNQEKRRWTMADIEAADNNTVVYNAQMLAEGLEPGTWTGTVEFFISLDEGGKLWKPAGCETPATLLGVDANDNGVLDTGEEATTTETKGVPLGHKFAEDETAFPAVCQRCNAQCYTISTPAQLTAFRDSVNGGKTYAGTTVTLNNDIDMTGVTWDQGIATVVGSAYNGSFDGKGYTIKNLSITCTDVSKDGNFAYCGLFGYVCGDFGTSIQNFTLDAPNYTLSSVEGANSLRFQVGLIAGSVETSGRTLSNVHVKNGSLSFDTGAAGGIYCGGLVGKMTGGDITNCSIVGTTVYATSTYTYCDEYEIGGLIGYGKTGSTSSNGTKYPTVSNCLSASYCSVDAPYYDAEVNINALGCGKTKGVNCVYDTDRTTRTYSTNAPSSKNCLACTSVECKGTEALAVLNTDNEGYTWYADLENTNGGYPVVKAN